MSAPIFFLDTNAFLECRALAELPWSDLTASPNIRLFTPQTVVREIDSLKSSTGRKAKRARLANALMNRIIDSVSEEIEIKPSSPRVTIAIIPFARLREDEFPDLDLTIADHRIVAEILLFTRTAPAAEVAFLTTDGGARLVARDQKVTVFKIPDDEKWRMPPEQGDEQREIQSLRQRLKELESNFASVKISLWPQAAQELPFSARKYRKLTDEQVETLVGHAQRYSQQKTHELDNPNTPFRPFWLTEQQIDQYKNVLVPKWLASVRSFLRGLPNALTIRQPTANMALKLECIGSRPADFLTLEVRVKGGVLLRTPEHKEELDHDHLKLPTPPDLSFASLTGFSDILAVMRPMGNEIGNLSLGVR